MRFELHVKYIYYVTAQEYAHIFMEKYTLTTAALKLQRLNNYNNFNYFTFAI